MKFVLVNGSTPRQKSFCALCCEPIGDALKYLPQMGLDPSCVVDCAGTKCQNSFALADGFAVEAIVAKKLSIVSRHHRARAPAASGAV
jgi:hypothetical protein